MIKKELIEHYYIDEEIFKLSKKEKEIVVNELFKKEYIGKEISYLLEEKEIKAIINSKTRNNFFVRNHHGKIIENNKEYNLKLNIVYKKEYIKLLSKANFINTKKDNKNYISRNHNKKYIWINYSKIIYINYELFEVKIVIQQKENKFVVYNLKIKEVSSSASN